MKLRLVLADKMIKVLLYHLITPEKINTSFFSHHFDPSIDKQGKSCPEVNVRKVINKLHDINVKNFK